MELRLNGAEIAGAESCVRNRVSDTGCAAMVPYQLQVEEEKQLVLEDRPADGAAEFVVGERVLPLGRIFEVVTRIQLLVT